VGLISRFLVFASAKNSRSLIVFAEGLTQNLELIGSQKEKEQNRAVHFYFSFSELISCPTVIDSAFSLPLHSSP
jgi:hypothetical protein